MSPTLLWSTGERASTDRPGNQPTDRPCPSQSRDIDRLHVPTLHAYVRSESDKGRRRWEGEKQQCEAGKRERPAKTKESPGDRGQMGG